MLKKVIGWLVLIGIIVFVVAKPHAAAGIAGGIGTGIGAVAKGFGTFFSDLAGG